MAYVRRGSTDAERQDLLDESVSIRKAANDRINASRLPGDHPRYDQASLKSGRALYNLGAQLAQDNRQ
jgi:hypothetical protein